MKKVLSLFLFALLFIGVGFTADNFAGTVDAFTVTGNGTFDVVLEEDVAMDGVYFGALYIEPMNTSGSSLIVKAVIIADSGPDYWVTERQKLNDGAIEDGKDRVMIRTSDLPDDTYDLICRFTVTGYEMSGDMWPFDYSITSESGSGATGLTGAVGPAGADGDIDSSGSNARGYWIRFANGMQICTVAKGDTVAISTAWGDGLFINSGGAITWIFPMPFTTLYGVSGTSDGANSAWLMHVNGSTTSIDYYHVRGTSIGSTDRIARQIAIGRWE